MMNDEEINANYPGLLPSIEQMTDGQAKARCSELSAKLDVPEHPQGISPNYPIPPHTNEEDVEYYLLKKRLGPKCGS